MLRLPFLPFRLLRTFVRVVGFKNSIFILLGIGIGLLLAPTPGADLRAKLAERLGGTQEPPDAVLVAVGEGPIDL